MWETRSAAPLRALGEKGLCLALDLVDAWNFTPEALFCDVRPREATRETRLAAPLRALGAEGLRPALDTACA